MSISKIEVIRVDDIPLLLALMTEMGIEKEIDKNVKRHGLWQGISVGKIVVIWMSYILTMHDHRLEPVQKWVNKRKALFNRLLGIELRETDMTDDRLAKVLTMLGKEETQALIDESWNQEWITMYELPTEITRYDSTSVTVYKEADESEDSIIGYGFSKDHRPDLAQFKIMLSTLDMGMPLTCQVVNGKRADDGLYIPAYKSVTKTMGHANFLGVGDGKMAAWASRCSFATGGSWYLCPYRGTAAKGEDTDSWIETALEKGTERQEVTRIDEITGEISTIASVYEWSREQQTLNAQNETVTWTERVLVSHSPALQKGMTTRRLRSEQKAFAELEKLLLPPKRGRKRYRTAAELQEVVDKLLKKRRLGDIIDVSLASQPHKDKGQRWAVSSYQRNEAAWQAMLDRLGWQIYLTSVPTTLYNTAQVIHAYRRQPHLERGISRLKSRNLRIRPVFLSHPQRIVGLTWLLILALRLLVLMEFRVRRELSQLNESLQGLKSGNLTTATQRPTTEKMLEAFTDINWSIVSFGDTQHYHITPLNDTQRHILRLLHLPTDIYTLLAAPASKPLLFLRE